MSAPAIAVPGSVQRNLTSTPLSNETSPQQQQQDIARLAYALWQQRGNPDGSSEQDWLEAERILQSQNQPETSRTSR